jgi:hypothetical protein
VVEVFQTTHGEHRRRQKKGTCSCHSRS